MNIKKHMDYLRRQGEGSAGSRTPRGTCDHTGEEARGGGRDESRGIPERCEGKERREKNKPRANRRAIQLRLRPRTNWFIKHYLCESECAIRAVKLQTNASVRVSWKQTTLPRQDCRHDRRTHRRPSPSIRLRFRIGYRSRRNAPG